MRCIKNNAWILYLNYLYLFRITMETVMKKITDKIVSAFINRKSSRLGNTWTDGTTLYLHGNIIARWDNDILQIRTAGWESKTTKERLNGLLYKLGLPTITQRNYQWYIGDTPWYNSHLFIPLKTQ